MSATIPHNKKISLIKFGLADGKSFSDGGQSDDEDLYALASVEMLA